jgi:hypothetical protein
MLQTRSSASMLPVLAEINPRLFWDQADAIEPLLTQRTDDPEVWCLLFFSCVDHFSERNIDAFCCLIKTGGSVDSQNDGSCC